LKSIEAIWSFARDHGFMLVSKDDDFRSLALVRGAPPEVVWLQIGNAPTSKVADLLRANVLVLEAFSNEPDEALISPVETDLIDAVCDPRPPNNRRAIRLWHPCVDVYVSNPQATVVARSDCHGVGRKPGRAVGETHA